jgi:hypothetical protein
MRRAPSDTLTYEVRCPASGCNAAGRYTEPVGRYDEAEFLSVARAAARSHGWLGVVAGGKGQSSNGLLCPECSRDYYRVTGTWQEGTA